MNYKSLFIPKTSHTYSDTLILFGLETLVTQLFNVDTELTDAGSFYELIFETPITSEMFDTIEYQSFTPYVINKDSETDPIGKSINLAKNIAEIKAWTKLPDEERKNNTLQLDEYFDIANAIQYMKAATTYNNILEEVYNKKDDFNKIIEAIFEWFSTPFQFNKQIPSILANFPMKKITKLSLFNPDSSKGVHSPGAKENIPGNQTGEWFIEWLKYIGIFKCGFVKTIIRDKKTNDTKVYVFEPKSVPNTEIYQIYDMFSQNLPKVKSTPIKTDIQILLSFLKTFLQFVEAKEWDELNSHNKPYALIQGFYSVYFFDMGQAKTVSNISYLSLPSWINVKTYKDLSVFFEIIENHNKVIHGLEEDGNTYQMFQQYRNFLSGEDIYSFLDFCSNYAALLMSQIGEPLNKRRYKYLALFQTKELEEVLTRVKPNVSEIISSLEFKAIAKAIRNSTISLLYIDKKKRNYEVRYGLAQDLKRKCMKKELLIEYLCEFCASYNQENARVKERKNVEHSRKNIAEKDITKVIELIEEHGTIVGKLLLAYGYAKTEKEGEKMVNQRTQINSISINGRLMLNLHSLNNEGGEGNQILTRIVTILDKNGELASVNAISGDMFKHIQSDHLIKILNEQGIALCNNCKLADPNRISGDDEFIKYIKDKKPLDSELMQAMLKKCACDDLEGILITEGRNTARKSVVEFGWVVGIPEQTITENFFHVKFASDASKKKGEAKESKEERASNKGQNIFHRPTNSGNYATVLHLETSRIGFNDYSRVYEITEEERQQRYEALLKSVLYFYMNPEGAMRAAQNPHIVNFEGVISYSTSATPAPTVSALTDSYDEEIKEIAEALNTMEGKSEDVVYLKPFKSMSEFVKAMTELVQTTSPEWWVE